MLALLASLAVVFGSTAAPSDSGMGVEVKGQAVESESDSATLARFVDSLVNEIPARIPCGQDARAKVSYDKFNDVTNFTVPYVAVGERSSFTLVGTAKGRADKPEPGAVMIVFNSTARSAMYSRGDKLHLLLDDSIRSTSTPTYMYDVKRNSFTRDIVVAEHLGIKVSFASFVAMAKARSISVKAGTNAFDLPAKSVDQIGCFAASYK